MLYAVLDGFDLGIAILFPTTKDEGERDQMMNSGRAVLGRQRNLAGAGRRRALGRLPAGLCHHHARLLHPGHPMLLALIFRGVAFEFRWVAVPITTAGTSPFWLGSTVAAFSQGLILGGLIQGITVANGQFAGGPFDWLTPFTVMRHRRRWAMPCSARPG